MNVRYDFTQTGGFPLDQGVLNDLQNGILLTEAALANLLGPLAIISGCAVSGGSAANGVVAINGQVLPFVGGLITAKVIIIENDTNLTYEDGTPRPSNITRYATFGDDGVQNKPWASFTTTGFLPVTGDVKEIDVSEAYITANFDSTGLGINQRLGWAICNGNNGTKDRRGRVSVQRDTTQVEFETMAQTGGEKTHLIAPTEVPRPAGLAPGLDGPHNKPADGGGPPESYVNGALSTAAAASTAHNNLQPYITPLFIQKL